MGAYHCVIHDTAQKTIISCLILKTIATAEMLSNVCKEACDRFVILNTVASSLYEKTSCTN